MTEPNQKEFDLKAQVEQEIKKKFPGAKGIKVDVEEPEPKPAEVEAVPIPVTRDIQPKEVDIMTKPQDFDSNRWLKMAEEQVLFMNKLSIIGLKATDESDWVNFGDMNVYPTAAGALRIRRNTLISIWNVKCEREDLKDKRGEYYVYTFTGNVGIKQRGDYIEVLGTCSSRDTFFAKEYGKWKQIEEIDTTNIKKAARTNMVANGITEYLGLKKPGAKRFRQAGLDITKVPHVKFGTRKK